MEALGEDLGVAHELFAEAAFVGAGGVLQVVVGVARLLSVVHLGRWWRWRG